VTVLQVNSLFCLEVALGCLLLLPFFPSKEISRGFFALHGGIAALALLLAALLDPAWRHAEGLRGGAVLPAPWALASLFVLSVVGTVLAGASLRRPADVVFGGAAVLVAGLFLTGRAGLEPGVLPTLWLLAGALLAATTTMAMNLGHWYLVTKELDFRHLIRWASAYAAASVFRVLLFAGVAGAVLAGRYGIEVRERILSPFGDGFFAASRLLWGLVGTTTLAVFVVRTARMRSNQAATGLLYVALVFTMVGELLAAYLTIRTGVPL
jgi:hypothetical protein